VLWIFDPASEASLKKVESRTVAKKKVLLSEIPRLEEDGTTNLKTNWEDGVAPNSVVFNHYQPITILSVK